MLELLFEQLQILKEGFLDVHKGQPLVFMQEVIDGFRSETERKKVSELLTREEEHCCRQVADTLDCYLLNLRENCSEDGEAAFGLIREWFDEEQDGLELEQDEAGLMLEHVFDFMEEAYGTGQEMVIFITELNGDYYSVKFLQQYDCERYYRYNKELLFEEGRMAIETKLQELGR